MTVLTRSTGLEIPARPVEAPLTTRVGAGRTVGPRLEAVLVRSAASPPIDIVDQWGEQSFPASDPPANW
jgi:hypothetical protein